ncbi:hypothetical protein Tco_0845854 [Tanacetum coccineum]
MGNHPWLVLGDFNVTMDTSKHSSGGSFRTVDMNWKLRFEHSGGLLAGIHGLFSGRYSGLVRRDTCGYPWPGLEGNHRDFEKMTIKEVKGESVMEWKTKVTTKEGIVIKFPGKFRGYKLTTEEEVEENEGLKEVWEKMEYVISDSDSDLESTASS